MRDYRGILSSFVLIGLALVAATGGANAACALAGTWYFYDMQAQSPNIQTNMTSVVVGPSITNKKNLETFTFTKSSTGYQNGTARVIQCTLKVQSNGKFSAPCTSYGDTGQIDSTTVSGTLSLSACNLSGTINVAGDPTPVTIKGGHMNGVMGAGIATQGATVHQFTLVKQ